MCNAWLLQPRHGPDGARAHTGYAYGHSVEPRSGAASASRRGRSTSPTGPRSAATSRGSHRSGSRAFVPQQYAHESSAHGVTRPRFASQAPAQCAAAPKHTSSVAVPARSEKKRRASDGVMAVSSRPEGPSRVICDGYYIQPGSRSYATTKAAENGSARDGGDIESGGAPRRPAARSGPRPRLLPLGPSHRIKAAKHPRRPTRRQERRGDWT